MDGGDFCAVDVDGVGEGLEGEEADADGEDDAEGGLVEMEVQGLGEDDGGIDEEVEVLEGGEDGEVHRDRDAVT